MFSLRNFSFKRGEQTILNNISFDICPNEWTVLLGRNGVGKSTLLKAIAGEYLTPSRHFTTSGQILIDEQPIQNFSPLSLSKKRAVLSQSTQIHFPFKGEEIVLLGRYPFMKKGRLSEVDYEIANEALIYADAKNLAHREVTSLSGGELTRIQFARVLSQIWPSEQTKHKYLLLDEPTASLDIGYQHYLLDTLSELKNKWSLGILSVLHDLNLSSRYGDKVVMLRDGEIDGYGETRSIFTVERIQRCYEVNVKVHHNVIDHLFVTVD